MLNWSKVTVNTFIIAYKNVFNKYINKCCSFELSDHQRIMKMYHIPHKNIKHHFWRITWSISGEQIFSVIIIFHNITVCFHSIFDQINATLVNIRDIFRNIKKTDFWSVVCYIQNFWLLFLLHSIYFYLLLWEWDFCALQ